jgi:hypothetical protein
MPQRLHHLDAARAVLLLLGIPFHVGTTATMILSPGFPAWMANPVLGWACRSSIRSACRRSSSSPAISPAWPASGAAAARGWPTG